MIAVRTTYTYARNIALDVVFAVAMYCFLVSLNQHLAHTGPHVNRSYFINRAVGVALMLSVGLVVLSLLALAVALGVDHWWPFVVLGALLPFMAGCLLTPMGSVVMFCETCNSGHSEGCNYE